MTRVWVGFDALESGQRGSAVTIGTFDGVHLGHRALVARTRQRARDIGATSVALTWDRHPSATLRPERTPLLLSTPERKIELLEETGLDAVAVLGFDEAFASMAPEHFVEEVLVRGLGARSVLVGREWRFGHKAAGTVDLLRAMGESRGFTVDDVDLQEVEGEPVSSSRTRRVVASGDMELARTLLGRAFDVDGVVRKGDQRGRTLGYPTANLDIDSALALPPRGVYAGRAHVNDLVRPAAINIGVNPTFGGDPSTSPLQVEAYLLDLEADMYDQTVRLEFWSRLRDEEMFDSVDDLVSQMAEDVAATRGLVTD